MPTKTNIITLHIIPKSSKNEILGWVTGMGEQKTLKIKITAAPEDGKANKELIKFLSKQWDISQSALELVAGETSRRKRLKIHSDALYAWLVAGNPNVS